MAKGNRRIFHHYIELEETEAGLWRRLNGDEKKQYVEAAADLMRCPQEFMEAMREALRNWPKSCEAAFTADSVNQIAYLGHAGCCVATGSPEECTRIGWHKLTKPEQDEANLAASIVLREWCLGYSQVQQLELFNA
jgi:hypothetical protein